MKISTAAKTLNVNRGFIYRHLDKLSSEQKELFIVLDEKQVQQLTEQGFEYFKQLAVQEDSLETVQEQRKKHLEQEVDSVGKDYFRQLFEEEREEKIKLQKINDELTKQVVRANEELISLSKQLTSVAQNNQVLLGHTTGLEKQYENSSETEGKQAEQYEEQPIKQSFWQRLLGNKK